MLKPQGSHSPDQAKDDPSDIPAVKKERTDNCEDTWLPSRRYWDSLPKHYLTKHALLEIARRYYREHPKVVFQRFEKPVRRSKRLKQSQSKPKKEPCQGKITRSKRPTPSLKRFARGGGPDLTSVCGYPYPIMADQSLPLNEFPDEVKSRKTKPYDKNYELALSHAGIYTLPQKDQNDRPIRPDNFAALLHRLEEEPRPSPLDRFTLDDFEIFKEDAIQEMRQEAGFPKTMATIAGRNNHFSWKKRKFDFMAPIDPILAPPVPDSYDGIDPADINSVVYDTLRPYITPCKVTSRPALPNFFELSNKTANPYWAMVEGMHAAAQGARGMWMMQNFVMTPKVYDNNAYSFLSIFHSGMLSIHAIHARLNPQKDNRPEYHITTLGEFLMIGTLKSFKEGANFYRNTRNLASEMRKSFVKDTNERFEMDFAIQEGFANMIPMLPPAGQAGAGNGGNSDVADRAVASTENGQGAGSGGLGISNGQETNEDEMEDVQSEGPSREVSVEAVVPPPPHEIDPDTYYGQMEEDQYEEEKRRRYGVPRAQSYAKLSDPGAPVVRKVRRVTRRESAETSEEE